MSQLLELAQLEHGHQVSEVQVDRGRVEPGVDAQRLAGREALAQLGFHGRLRGLVAVFDTLHEDAHLLFDGHGRHRPVIVREQAGGGEEPVA